MRQARVICLLRRLHSASGRINNRVSFRIDLLLCHLQVGSFRRRARRRRNVGHVFVSLASHRVDIGIRQRYHLRSRINLRVKRNADPLVRQPAMHYVRHRVSLDTRPVSFSRRPHSLRSHARRTGISRSRRATAELGEDRNGGVRVATGARRRLVRSSGQHRDLHIGDIGPTGIRAALYRRLYRDGTNRRTRTLIVVPTAPLRSRLTRRRRLKLVVQPFNAIGQQPSGNGRTNQQGRVEPYRTDSHLPRIRR